MRRLFGPVVCFLAFCLVLAFVSAAHAATAPAANQAGAPAVELIVPPYVARPTANSVVLNLVPAQTPLTAELRYRPEGAAEWEHTDVNLSALNMAQLREGVRSVALTGLRPGTRYEYELHAGDAILFAGAFVTQRPAGQAFRFAVMADAHINPGNPERNAVLRSSADTAALARPDFVLHMGDNIQTIGSTHGGPCAQEDHPNVFYIYFRQVLGALQGKTSQFVLNGNWEGENGWHPAQNRAWARQARMTFAPGPDNATYPEGGSPNQDYYAYTWGDALFVVLNVTGYTPTDHEIVRGPGKADEWTLGKEQMAWLERTLAQSKAPWKFLFIHHAVGGQAGDDINSRYGRGGGLAAKVGEQAKVHALMQKYGVQAFFYAHDHVFTDMTVDGIHYICSGSVGAPWKFGTAETGYEKFIPDSGFVTVDVDGKTAAVRYVRPDPAKAEGVELYRVDLKR